MIMLAHFYTAQDCNRRTQKTAVASRTRNGTEYWWFIAHKGHL